MGQLLSLSLTKKDDTLKEPNMSIVKYHESEPEVDHDLSQKPDEKKAPHIDDEYMFYDYDSN